MRRSGGTQAMTATTASPNIIKRPAVGPKFGTQAQVTAFVQSGAALPVPETIVDVQHTHNRTQFALRYDLVNKGDARAGHPQMKAAANQKKALAVVAAREQTCRKFKIGITKNPRKGATHGFPHNGYQVQYDRMGVLFRGARDLAGHDIWYTYDDDTYVTNSIRHDDSTFR